MMESISKLNFAIIGCGSIAKRHAININKYGKLIAVCDIVFEKAEALASLFNVKAYQYFEELLLDKSLNVICICTPNGLHAIHSIKALNAGFHVLVEKPMALSVFDCNLMIITAEKANKKLFVVKQNRFNPPVAAVKDAIENGVFGKIYSIQLSCFWNRDIDYYKSDWKGTKEMDGGILFTQFSHFIDILYWMFGDVERVFTLVANFAHKGIIEFEDSGVVAMEFCSGAIGSINYCINSFKKNVEGSLTIIAEKGTVKIGGQYLNEIEYQSIQDFEFKDLIRSTGANDYGTYTGSMSNHHKVYEQLIATLNSDQQIATNSFEAMKTVEIINKIKQSIISIDPI